MNQMAKALNRPETDILPHGAIKLARKWINLMVDLIDTT